MLNKVICCVILYTVCFASALLSPRELPGGEGRPSGGEAAF